MRLLLFYRRPEEFSFDGGVSVFRGRIEVTFIEDPSSEIGDHSLGPRSTGTLEGLEPGRLTVEFSTSGASIQKDGLQRP